MITRCLAKDPDDRWQSARDIVLELVAEAGFKVFSETVKKGGAVAGFVATGCASYSRSQLDTLTDLAKSLGAGGLVWARVTEAGVESPVEKFLGQEIFRAVNVSRSPPPWRRMTTPWKTWMRCLSPSTMRTCTSTVSPG